MRRASVAIVPILLAIALVFWTIWFMGQESQNTHVISDMQKLQQLQSNAALYAIKRKIELLEQGMDEESSEAKVKEEVEIMMQRNGE